MEEEATRNSSSTAYSGLNLSEWGNPELYSSSSMSSNKQTGDAIEPQLVALAVIPEGEERKRKAHNEKGENVRVMKI